MGDYPGLWACLSGTVYVSWSGKTCQLWVAPFPRQWKEGAKQWHVWLHCSSSWLLTRYHHFSQALAFVTSLWRQAVPWNSEWAAFFSPRLLLLGHLITATGNKTKTYAASCPLTLSLDKLILRKTLLQARKSGLWVKYNYHNVFKVLEKLTMKVRDGKSHLTMNVGAGRRPTVPPGGYAQLQRDQETLIN